MTLNPAAVVLLVVGFLAVIVGIRGTQKNAAQLLTGIATPDAAGGVRTSYGTQYPSGLAPKGPANASPVWASSSTPMGTLAPLGPAGP